MFEELTKIIILKWKIELQVKEKCEKNINYYDRTSVYDGMGL